MATTDLGKWMITNGGNYNPETTYEQLTMVMYDNSTYITLKTVTGITPSNDGINYILMAQGFSATALSSVTATDSSGLLGDVGNSVSAQSLVDYLADAVATKLLKKTDISTVQTDSNTTVPASSLLKATDDKIGDVTGLPEGVSNLAEAYAQLNSDIETIGDWKVIKQGNGLCIALARTRSRFSFPTHAGGAYYANSSFVKYLPEGLFQTVDNLFCTVTASSSGIFVASYGNNWEYSTSKTPSIILASLDNLEGVSCDVSLMVVGTWK